MQLFFSIWTTIGVFIVSIAMVLWFDPWWMMWLRLHLLARLIYHTWISAAYITRHRSRSREDHHLLWCNFSSPSEPPSVFLLYLSPWYSDLSHEKWCGFVCICWIVWFTKLGYLPVTSRDIDLAVDRIIICCDATFLLKLNHYYCFHCIYRHGTLIRAMNNAVDSSLSTGSFDLPYLDICPLHNET
jgi:hypothetical protein